MPKHLMLGHQLTPEELAGWEIIGYVGRQEKEGENLAVASRGKQRLLFLEKAQIVILHLTTSEEIKSLEELRIKEVKTQDEDGPKN